MIDTLKLFLKNHWKFICGMFLTLVVLNTILIGLYKLPAIHEIFELNKDSDNNISSSINNFISPILNFLTIILVYAAYVKQVEANIVQEKANRDAQENNNVQFCLSLFDSLNRDIENFYVSKTPHNSERTIHTGAVAISDITLSYYKGTFQGNTFGELNYGRMLMSLYYSFTTIKQWINSAIITDNNKELLNSKLKNFYYCWLAIDFHILKQAFEKHPRMLDYDAGLIIALVNEYDPDIVDEWVKELLGNDAKRI